MWVAIRRGRPRSPATARDPRIPHRLAWLHSTRNHRPWGAGRASHRVSSQATTISTSSAISANCTRDRGIRPFPHASARSLRIPAPDSAGSGSVANGRESDSSEPDSPARRRPGRNPGPDPGRGRAGPSAIRGRADRPGANSSGTAPTRTTMNCGMNGKPATQSSKPSHQPAM